MRLAFVLPRLAAFLLICLGALPAFATSFSARLVSSEGEPGAGYVVSVVGRPVSAVCDADGRFTLDPAPAPPFTLIATSPEGALSAPIEVTVWPADGTAMELVVPAAARDSLTVVAGIAPSLEVLPASAAVVVAREEIDQRAPRRLVEVLESVAGAAKLDGGADAVPALRGLARGRTLILIDGARVTAERRAGPSASFLDPASLSSVDVLRGPGSVVYGSDAFGGVINAVTRDPEPGNFALRFSLDASGGGLDEQAAFVGLSSEFGEAGSLLADFSYRDAGDSQAGDGEDIFNSAYTSWGGALRYVRNVGPGRLRLGLSIDRSEDLGKPAIDARAIRSIYPDEVSDRFTANWLGVPGHGWESLEATFFAGRYDLVLDRDRAPTATSNRRIDSADNRAKDASLRAVGARPLAGGRLQVGIDTHSRFDLEALTNRLDFAPDGTTIVRRSPQTSIENARQLSTGVFSTWTRPLSDRLSLGLGLRGDRVETKNEGGFFGDRSLSESALSGNVALSATLGAGWSATAQVARGFRVPTLSDRYFRGPSGRGFVVGNPDLEPETSQQLDLALRWGRRNTAVAIYGYHYQIDDLVERFQNGADFNFRNRGEATIQGLEIESQTRFGDHWSGELGAAYSDGETDGGANLDEIAPLNGWVTARWSHERGYVFTRLTVVAEKDDPGPIETTRDAYELLDLGAGYHLNDKLELRLIVRNLADELYFAAADAANDRSPGRSFTLALSGSL